MAFKKFLLDEQTEITIYKRRTNRSLKLTVAPNGEVKVTIPTWTPYQAGVNFAKSKTAWIKSQTGKQPTGQLEDGMAVGKSHHLRLVPTTSQKPTSRIKTTEIIINYPFEASLNDPEVQKVIEAACERALRVQAEALLPQRLAALAQKHGFSYNQVSIKKLRSRWGSCDQRKNIVLNLHLMNLSWELIDYVLLHELTHTKVLRHGPDFWGAMSEVAPESKALRRQIRGFHPYILTRADVV